jgi:ArsR family transcriptional regulator
VSWADSVAGDMERHYSPGRTWEATAKALVHLLRLGDVLDVASGDGVLAELLAPNARSILCLDVSERVVEAGRQRLQPFANARFELGDMHELPVDDASVDTVLLMHALTYTRRPEEVFRQAARVLRPGGQLLAVTLQAHKHEKAVQPYGHLNLGFSPDDLRRCCESAGLAVRNCDASNVEKRVPYFAVINLLAEKAG